MVALIVVAHKIPVVHHDILCDMCHTYIILYCDKEPELAS